jgi:hypothetical protein
MESLRSWNVLGGTGFLACGRIFAPPGKAVPPVKKLVGKDKPRWKERG